MSRGLKAPTLQPYVVIVSVLAVIWCVLVWAMALSVTGDIRDGELEDMMTRVVGRGVITIMAMATLVYAGHWAYRAVRNVPPELNSSPLSLIDTSTVSPRIAELGWSLELRGVGGTPGRYYPSQVWEKIKQKRDNFSSLYSQNSDDYEASSLARGSSLGMGTGVSFRMAARGSVAYWPLPVFAVEPPRADESMWRAAHMISTGQQKGQLGATQFLWQSDANADNAQGMIEQMFQFFEEHAEVPEALIASRDGDVMRARYRDSSGPDESRVPVVLDNTAALLVARTDRVDRYLRPYAPDYPEDSHNRKTDLGRLFAHFWAMNSKSLRAFMAEQTGDKAGNPPVGILQTVEWQAALPELWATIDNRGPGQFEPTPWLPVRWAKHQVEEFDRAPKLGHLHRPVKVALLDEQGRPLKAALQVKAMMAGWELALATLPEGEKPVRVFYDSTGNMDATIALNNALHELNVDGHGLDMGNVDEGYDIGRRLWNLGVGSALTQIGLAAIASYKDGGITAVVYAGDEGSVSIQMVRPPSDEEKAHNVNFGEDPFMWGF